MKIVIVTGGAGFVGSSLIEKLIILDKNIKIISLDNYSSGSKKTTLNPRELNIFQEILPNLKTIFIN